MKSAVKECKEPIAVVSIDTGTIDEEIRVYEGDDVQLTTELFCQRFGLGAECVEYIVDQINEEINKARSSPRFQNLAESFGPKIQEPHLQPRLTTEASSHDEADSDKKQIQLRWEEWHNKIKSKQQQPPSSINWNVPKFNNQNPAKPKYPTNERLYQDGREIMRNRAEVQENHKKWKDQLELEQATFHPQISPRSREIASKNKRELSGNIGQALYEKGQELNKKRMLEIQKRNEQFRKQSPFRPQGLGDHSRSPTPIHEKLYNDAREGKQKKEQFEKEELRRICPFQPKSRSPIRVSREQQDALVKRLFNEQEERQRKLQQKKFEQQQSTKSTFMPKITKDNHYLKVSKKTDYEDSQLALDIHKLQSHTHRNQQQISARGMMPQKTTSEIRGTELRQGSQSSQSSQVSVTQGSRFDQNVNKIFNILDNNDKDGYINKDTINLEGFDCEVLEQISEALQHLDDESLTVNVQQFKQICQQNGLEGYLSKLIL